MRVPCPNNRISLFNAKGVLSHMKPSETRIICEDLSRGLSTFTYGTRRNPPEAAAEPKEEKPKKEKPAAELKLKPAAERVAQAAQAAPHNLSPRASVAMLHFQILNAKLQKCTFSINVLLLTYINFLVLFS